MLPRQNTQPPMFSSFGFSRRDASCWTSMPIAPCRTTGAGCAAAGTATAAKIKTRNAGKDCFVIGACWYSMPAVLMNRRALLKTGGLALAGFGLPACRTTTSLTPVVPRHAPLRLAPVHVSFDRVVRTTVGLRPHRDGGFVLKVEKVGAKTIVHNYGHGGAGMSLAW